MNCIWHARIKYPEIYNGETNLFEKGIPQKEKGWPRRTTPVGA
jgi:hypothetical protein